MINNTFLRFLGITLILTYCYFRFIVVRLPRDLSNINENNFRVLLYLYLMCVSLLILLLCIITIFNIEIKQNNNIFTKGITKISDIINDSLDRIYNDFAEYANEYIDYTYEYLKRLTIAFQKRFRYKETLLIFIRFSPNIIVSLCFIIDIIIFCKFNYFYKSLVLLFLPRVFDFWINTVKGFSYNLTIWENQFFDVKITQLPNKNWGFEFEIKYECSPELEKLILEFYADEYTYIARLKPFMEEYDEILDYYKPRILGIIHSIYIIGYIYILYPYNMIIENIEPFSGLIV